MNSKHLVGALCTGLFLAASGAAQAVSVSGQGTWESSLQGRDLDGDLSTFVLKINLSPLYKAISGIDEDIRAFTSTYTFDRENLTLTYVKIVEGTTYTEVIALLAR